jgi:methylmalonyl-CoA/ethylmalonyl-CoA epimerase
MTGKITKLHELGMNLVQKGEYAGGRYAYIDSTMDLKVMLELLEND